MHYQILTNVEWQHIEERMLKMLSSWKVKLLSFGRRLVLINSMLSNMHFIKFVCLCYLKEVYTKWIIFIKKIPRRRNNEWKMECVCKPKDQGGLTTHDLEVKNTTLLGK
jgi:hypothetical protein